MVNESKKGGVDKATLIKSFDRAAVVIKELEEEFLSLQNKFGTSSKLADKKLDQAQALSFFYKTTKEYIDFLRELNYKMGVNYQAMELLVMHHETGLPYEKIARILGLSLDEQGKFKKLDDAEPMFRRIMAEIKELENIKLKPENEAS